MFQSIDDDDSDDDTRIDFETSLQYISDPRKIIQEIDPVPYMTQTAFDTIMTRKIRVPIKGRMLIIVKLSSISDILSALSVLDYDGRTLFFELSKCNSKLRDLLNKMPVTYPIKCLLFYETSYFVFRQSNIWKTLLHEVELILLDNKDSNQKTMIQKNSEIPFIRVFRILYLFISNAHLLQKEQWSELLKVNWINFLKSWIKIYFTPTQNIWGCLFIINLLVSIGLRFGDKTLKSDWESMSTSIFCMFESIKPRKKMIELYKTEEASVMLSAIFASSLLFDALVTDCKRASKMKWNHMCCYNKTCKIKRYEKRLYKCKSCNMARYCCKLCQKIDWNKSNHKMLCLQLADLQLINSDS
eukprot:446932_1